MTGIREEMTCQELVELVTEYLEGSLAPLDIQRFERHLATCDGCANYVSQMRRTIQLLGRLAVDDIPTDQQSALIELFRNWRQASL